MALKLISQTFALSACLILSSCGDDPELVKKREQQKAEMARLEGEVALLTEKLASLPPDRSSELADMKTKTESQAAELEKIDAEIVALEAKKRALENEFDAYKKKYPVNR